MTDTTKTEAWDVDLNLDPDGDEFVSRQVRRANERRLHKMPPGFSSKKRGIYQ